MPKPMKKDFYFQMELCNRIPPLGRLTLCLLGVFFVVAKQYERALWFQSESTLGVHYLLDGLGGGGSFLFVWYLSGLIKCVQYFRDLFLKEITLTPDGITAQKLFSGQSIAVPWERVVVLKCKKRHITFLLDDEVCRLMFADYSKEDVIRFYKIMRRKFGNYFYFQPVNLHRRRTFCRLMKTKIF